ncbi:hypothetical protein [Pandoraea sp. SD6-2]|uniref:hypothetical protein n=1 Tax=Pandoraea sp. SD6-2 TaxID=1286093 RepID=UPI001185E664|nr:hypothetical protein [Pandoraea sp. SD6-2]
MELMQVPNAYDDGMGIVDHSHRGPCAFKPSPKCLVDVCRNRHRLQSTKSNDSASLMPALRNAVINANYARAKEHAADIQSLLRATGHETRLMQAKNWLFESAMQAGELKVAELGFTGIRQKTSPQTKVYAEATALLAVCLLRQRRLPDAEPLIAEVLASTSIRDLNRRRRFLAHVTQRFEQESFVEAIRNLDPCKLDFEAIHDEASHLVRTKTDDEIYADIGRALPPEVVAFVRKVDLTTRRQLTVTEIKYLPPSANLEKKSELGKSFFSSLKLVV